MKLPCQVLVFLLSMSFPSHGTKKCWEEEGSTLEDDSGSQSVCTRPDAALIQSQSRLGVWRCPVMSPTEAVCEIQLKPLH